MKLKILFSTFMMTLNTSSAHISPFRGIGNLIMNAKLVAEIKTAASSANPFQAPQNQASSECITVAYEKEDFLYSYFFERTGNIVTYYTDKTKQTKLEELFFQNDGATRQKIIVYRKDGTKHKEKICNKKGFIVKINFYGTNGITLEKTHLYLADGTIATSILDKIKHGLGY